jgi:two-component system cell cycle sensor histidine kinase/response regulator CckA
MKEWAASRREGWTWWVLALPPAFLLLSVYYGLIGFHQVSTCFSLTPSWTVLSVDDQCRQPYAQMEPGDRVLKIGNITFAEAHGDRLLYLLRDLPADGPAPVILERGGRRQVAFIVRSHSSDVFSRLNAYLFPLVFWVVGTIALLAVRPRDHRQLVLALFCFCTSVWGASGMAGGMRWGYSPVVFRAFVWPAMALMVHLHLILPEALFGPDLQRRVLRALYALVGLNMLIDHLGFWPRGTAALGMAVAMLASGTILLARVFGAGSVAGRVVSRILLGGTLIGISPVLLLILGFQLFPDDPTFFNTFAGSLAWFFTILLPFWPLSYLYALYRVRPANIEFRANRLIATYGFFALVIVTVVVSSAILRELAMAEARRNFATLLMCLVIVLVATASRQRFQALVDRVIYGIRYQPEEILSVFATRIPQAFSRAMLRDVICDEVLPALMVRQSALYLLRDDDVEIFYERNLPSSIGGIDLAALEALARIADPKRSIDLEGHPTFGWLRLFVPLENQDKTIGWWLFGQRDPDDFYDRPEIEVLSSLANQVAPVVENFRLLEMAQLEIEENRRLQEQLIQSQKMEAIGRLSAGVAHDFNNLLSVILGYSSLLMAKYQGDESLQRYLGDIRDAGNRAASLTKQLLAFSRQQVMEAKIVNLNGVVEDVDKMLRRLAGEDIEVTTRLEQDLPMVKVDPAQMSQVILNLAVNARDAMPDGGELTLETSLAFLHDELEDAHQTRILPGPYVLLRVADTGTGIDAKVRARIFEPYFTTKEMGKGTGLGLSMVYGIIRQSRGAIQVESTIGAGTTFKIFLPVAAEETGPVVVRLPETARIRGSEPKGTGTVFVVEDEDSVRSVACEILESAGYRVLQAANGAEALAQLADRDVEIDLLLTDVIMPHMKGTELARRLLEVRRDVKVVYMSGYNEESILGSRLGESGVLMIQKPFQPQDLIDQVRRALLS